MANRWLKDEGHAEDLVQELMIKLSKRWGNFHEEEKVKAWLYISLRNACFNEVVNQKRALKRTLPLLEDSTPSIEADIIYAEVVNELHICIEKLPAGCKKVFNRWLLCNKQGQAKEAAKELGISIHTFWSQVQKATNLIKMQVGESYNMHFANPDYYKNKRV